MMLLTDLTALNIHRDDWGRLVLTMPDGRAHVGIEPIRCFPLSDPHKSISIVDADGKELLTLPELHSLNASARQMLEAELTAKDFVPIIQRIVSTNNLHPPCQWNVLTDRGQTQFQLESEDDVRKLGTNQVLLADSNGIRYLIQDLKSLDAVSRRIVQRIV